MELQSEPKIQPNKESENLRKYINFTLNTTSLQQEHVMNGPFICNTDVPVTSLMSKLGKHDQFCLILPTTVPGGAEISISCRQHGKQQESQRSGRFKAIAS
jgi:hypothetical protein